MRNTNKTGSLPIVFNAILISSLLPIASFAQERSVPVAYSGKATSMLRPLDRKDFRFNPILQKYANDHQNDPMLRTYLAITEIVSDRELDATQKGLRSAVLYRADLVQRLMDILLRRKGRFPIVIGEPGVGKTAVISELVHQIAIGNIPRAEAFQVEFDDAVVVRTSMRYFIPGSSYDFAAYIRTLKKAAAELRKNIILVVNESHFISEYNVSVLKSETDASNPFPVILETDSKSYGRTIKAHPSFTSIAETIVVPEPKAAEIKEILRFEALQELTQEYNIEFTDEVLSAIVDVASDYRRDVAEPRRSLMLLEDFAIARHRAAVGTAVTPSRVDLYRFVAEQVRLPVIPQNEAEFAAYMQKVKKELKEELVGQDPMIDGVVDQFVAALTSRSRQHSVALVLGPTGVGKSLLFEKLAQKFYGDKARFKELDMTQFKNESNLTTLFGAANGYISSDREKGALCDFFDGPARGGGILLLNEIEEMSSEALTRFMEIFDKGEFAGGDGKIRYIGRTLIGLTSNKNSDRILSHEAIRGMMRDELNRRVSLITQDQLKKAFTEKASYSDDSGNVVKTAVLERVDKLYFASPLLLDDGIKVAQIEIDRYVRNYERQGETKVTVDPSVARVMTSAFYNEALGARQVRSAVQQVFTKAIQEFKLKYGYDSRALEISAKQHAALKTVSFVTVKDPATGNSLTIDGPKIPVKNRLLDKDFRQRLLNLAENIKKEIFGQDEAIDMLVGAIKGHYFQGAENDVVSGFLLGVTGSGKSEIAKLIAKHLYGRQEAVGLFEMGKIQHKSDLSTILSPGKGIIGSDEPGELETFLINYPDGGVLLFDEMSNAGAGEPGLKEAIAKAFYTMLQEGYYKSPSGKVYDLSKYVVIFTGNDGENIFKGLSSDSLLEERYKEVVKDPAFADEILSEGGFTDAFIGRLSFATMMRPTLSPTKTLIARKLLNQWKKEVEANQPFDVTFDDSFAAEVGNLMFSPMTGARSIKKFIKKVVGRLVSDKALPVDWDSLLTSGDRMKIHLSVSTKKPSVPFFKGDEPEKNEAILNLVMDSGGAEVARGSLDFTEQATFMPQVHEDIAKGTAYHEMGHGVTTFDRKIVKITIIPEKIGSSMTALGYAQSRDLPRKTAFDQAFLIGYVASLLGGSEAEYMFGSDWNGGRSDDVDRAGKIVRRLVLDAHMNPEFDAVAAYVDKGGNVLQSMPYALKEKFDAYVNVIMEQSRELARKLIMQRSHVVIAGAKFLLKYGSINEQEFERLQRLGNELQPEMDRIVQEGWSIEKAETVVIDIDKIRAPSCEGMLGTPALAATAAGG